MIIVAAFEPFGGRRINRSWQAVEQVRAPVARVLLPVAFARLAAIVPELARTASALLLVGEANRRALSIERRAVNQADARLADNDGAQPHEPLEPGGPGELAATWNAARALAAARSAGVAVELSDDAGRFCCNASLYRALRAASPTTPVGFLHVPAARWPIGPATARVARAIDAIVATMSSVTGS